MVGINRRGLRNLRLSDGMIVHLALTRSGSREKTGPRSLRGLTALCLLSCCVWSFSDYLCPFLNICFIFLLLSTGLFPPSLLFRSILFSLVFWKTFLLLSIPLSPASSTFFFLLDLFMVLPSNWTCQLGTNIHMNIYIPHFKNQNKQTRTRQKQPKTLVLNPHFPLSNQPSLWALSQMSWKSSPHRLPPPPFSLAPYSILIRSVLKCSSWEVLFHSYPKFLTSFIQHSWPLPLYTLCFLFWIITLLVFLLPFWPFHLTLLTGI